VIFLIGAHFKKNTVSYDKITTVKVKTLSNPFSELKLQRIDLLKI